MICSFCKIDLEEAILCNVMVHYCPRCYGLWFEEEELRWAKDEKDRNLRWLDIDLWKEPEKFRVLREEKFCPRCRLPMYEVNYGDSKVKVDICNICYGVWLDRGEFKQICQYLKQKGKSEVLHNYAKNLMEEFWEIFTGPELLREEILDFLTILKLLNYKLATQYPNITKIIAGLPK